MAFDIFHENLYDIYPLFYRENETTEQTKLRQNKCANFIENLRQNETVSDYDRRLAYQNSYRAKENKSKIRRQKNLTYLLVRKKARLEKESFQEKNQRRKEEINYRNWKEQYTR